jgi:GNAT superfamily N-acetyltransferase
MAGADAIGRIRRARSADIDRLVEIRAAVTQNRLADPTSVSADDYARFIERRGCWVWDEDVLISGFSALDFERRSLWALFVAPEAQGRGSAGRSSPARSPRRERRACPRFR